MSAGTLLPVGDQEPSVGGVRSVALIPSSYHPYFGGVEEHTRHVAAGLRERGVAVEVWTPDRGEGLGTQEVDGVLVRYLPTPLPARNVASLASLAVRAPSTVAAWLQAWRQFRPDVLHVQCFGPNGTYALGLAAMTRSPLVVSSHGETFMDDHDVFGRSALQRHALTVSCSRAGAVTACSTVVSEDLRDRFGADDVAVVPNGVKLSPTSRPPREAGGEQVVIAAGRLVEKKGLDLLIRAVPTLPDHARVQIVGDGSAREALEILTSSLGIDDRVDFLGRREATEVQELMGQADVVVVPSRAEAFGIVVLEAWASGTPLVATNRGGPADLVTDGVDGRLVDPEDTAAMTRVITEVLDDHGGSARMAAQGLETVKEYTWDRVVEDYLGIYGSMHP